jgi:hypothetical protein
MLAFYKQAVYSKTGKPIIDETGQQAESPYQHIIEQFLISLIEIFLSTLLVS